MEEKQFAQMQTWFNQLNVRMDQLDVKIENRFTALLTVCTNTRNDLEKLRKDVELIKVDVQSLRKDVDLIKVDVQSLRKDVDLIKIDVQFLRESHEKYEKYDARITVLELALKEIERRLTH